MPLLAMLLYALLVTPMVIDVRADAGEELRLQARVQFWHLAVRFDAAVRRGKDGAYLTVRESPAVPGAKGLRVRITPLVRLLAGHSNARHFLLSRIRLHELTLLARVGTGDAAYTAWLCGALEAFCFPLARFIRRRHGILPRIDVRHAWHETTLLAHAQGIIALLPGDIMAALVLAAARKLRKEARKKWTGIPLKA